MINKDRCKIELIVGNGDNVTWDVDEVFFDTKEWLFKIRYHKTDKDIEVIGMILYIDNELISVEECSRTHMRIRDNISIHWRVGNFLLERKGIK